ncbi:MAG: DUF3473 domain-containing protein [Gemmatimonadales bacterium]|nr:MAG: DUF3473 domain-containing protein [Gemmatimonadales bacterium]
MPGCAGGFWRPETGKVAGCVPSRILRSPDARSGPAAHAAPPRGRGAEPAGGTGMLLARHERRPAATDIHPDPSGVRHQLIRLPQDFSPPPGHPHVSPHRVVHHHFTVDVEEYFQVSAMEPHVPRSAWDTLPSRVVDSTVRILDLLEAHDTRGTFFTLGWVARRHPDLVRRIAKAGHEVASHGWDHKRVTQLDPEAFRTQARDSRAILEDLSGKPVRGYRAPSFSIVPGLEWALEILAEEGYAYDSSLYPVRRRGYGFPGGGRHVHALPLEAGPLTEVPPLTIRARGFTLPAGGGGTFRQLPLAYTVRAFAAMEAEGMGGGTFYIHPWEVDPGQPRVDGVPLRTRIRHYRGLARTETRLAALLARFRFRPIAETLAAGN